MLTYGVIFLAEIGDKSQLVCMTLASKHRSKPIIIGSALAFGLLNALAVTFGGTLTHFVPSQWLNLSAALLFIIFGLHSLFAREDDDEGETIVTNSGKNILFITFSMIFLAELGDKTQLGVITLSTTYHPFMIWLGATLALISTSALGIFAGRKLLTRINPAMLHRLSGLLFIVIGVLISTRLF